MRIVKWMSVVCGLWHVALGWVPDQPLTGDWCGRRTCLEKQGVAIQSLYYLDDTWNLQGGRRPSPSGGDFEYLFTFAVTARSGPLWGYEGGRLYGEFSSHYGRFPFLSVGSFEFVDNIEARHFNELYALSYKQEFCDKRVWGLIGKSDADDIFTHVAHAILFINPAYTTLPTIEFFPTYPDPAMSIIGSCALGCGISVTGGIFDGSTADGYSTGKLGVFGHFFNHLSSHAFLVGEGNVEWTWGKKKRPGRLGVGGWRHTAHFARFGGGTQSGTSGWYATLDQVLYKTKRQEGGLFVLYGDANPQISPVQRYLGVAGVFSGLLACRPQDSLGVGWSCSYFTEAPEAGFTDSYEAFYEVFYQIKIASWGYLQPDFQYVVHPGGRGLPNASVLTVRLYLNL